MKHGRGLTLIEVCIVIAICMILFAAPVVSFAECRAKSGAMQVRYTWGPVQGCMIEVKPGRWVPLANYREVP